MDTSGVPKRRQITKDLLAELASGKYQVGDEFHKEPDLEKRFQSSRGTVRRALDDLKRDGYLTSFSGKGTFVARIPRTHDILSLSALFRQSGLEPSSVVLDKALVPAGDAAGRVMEGLRTEPKELVYRIRRLRLGNGLPLALQTVYLCPEDCPNLLNMDLSGSLVDLYAEQYNRRLVIADEHLQVVPTSPEVAQLLRLEADTVMVQRDRILL